MNEESSQVDLLTPQQAFAAAGIFLHEVFVDHYEFEKLGEFGLMIADMECYGGYVCTDAAYWEDWLRQAADLLTTDYPSLNASKTEPCLSPDQAFKAMHNLVRFYMAQFHFHEHALFFEVTRPLPDGTSSDPELRNRWQNTCADARAGRIEP